MISEVRNLLLVPGTPFALVEGVVALSQLADRPPAMPAAYVVPLRAASSENQRATGDVLQRTADDIGVIIIFENLAAPLGEPGTDELEALYDWVRRQLVGETIHIDFDPLEHIAGELVKARGGVIWWQESFGTAHYQEGA